ncbi:YbaK/EbsC family protein [Humidesulfovibrio idahonensis]
MPADPAINPAADPAADAPDDPAADPPDDPAAVPAIDQASDRAAEASPAYAAMLALVEADGAAFTMHEHTPTRTMEEARENLRFDLARIVKTIAFATRAGRLVLAALRGTRRVDYARLAALVGVNRKDIAALAPAEVLTRLGVAPGSVSPLLPAAMGMNKGMEGVLTLLDEDALAIAPTAYCGLGRPDRTLEMTPQDLARVAGAATGAFSR